ncbi:alpha amylase C-terminal domain-containing protein [Salinicola avicenniae]|uniref:alpha amylase C-terminal domain-containing protein n=1 Tax=Salinicola avicenniae TaxID=2916836 RepID=UPI0020731D5D|nr:MULTISPECIES: alpha amylase C-terminal domain-containing protein [unclassified Salinicola]
MRQDVVATSDPGREGHARAMAISVLLAASVPTGAGQAGDVWPWDDDAWMRSRAGRHGGDLPLSLYRLDAADWYASRFSLPLDWDRLAQELVPYVADLGFTHIVLDAALIEQPPAIVCQFVETCHVAGVGVLVRRPTTMAPLAWQRWCRQCHVDGSEEAAADSGLDGREGALAAESAPPDHYRLFLDAAASDTVALRVRSRWANACLRYLADGPGGRSRQHEAWVAALTPGDADRSILMQLPETPLALGQWRLSVAGNSWQRFAALRACLALMWALPGDKLLAMGVELGQVLAPPSDRPLHWPLLFENAHAGVLRLVADLNRLYVNEPALQVPPDERLGFEWLIDDDRDNSVIVFARHAESGHATLICLSNFQGCVHQRYRLGVPYAGWWREIFNSDSVFYTGDNIGNGRGVRAEPIPSHGHAHSLDVSVPPMATLFLRHEVWHGAAS